MSYLIAAAGTGGHVFPGLAVGEALIELGVDQSDVFFVGGKRLEAEVYPAQGFPFLALELAGLKRQLTLVNFKLPLIVARATRVVAKEIAARSIRAALGLGGYVTVPVALGSRRAGIPLLLSEQNASAGLANRLASRIARRSFGSFPVTKGLRRAEWVGNPVRRRLRSFDRLALRSEARRRYGLDPDRPVLGIIGGSLGAGVLNLAAAQLAATAPSYQILNLAGAAQAPAQEKLASVSSATWVVRAFESEMEMFFAAVDGVVARAGGAVSELTATGTPAVLIPGRFGSSGHQEANASAMAATGAALVVAETELDQLPLMVATMMDPGRHSAMQTATKRLARPDAALDIARALIEAHS